MDDDLYDDPNIVADDVELDDEPLLMEDDEEGEEEEEDEDYYVDDDDEEEDQEVEEEAEEGEDVYEVEMVNLDPVSVPSSRVSLIEERENETRSILVDSEGTTSSIGGGASGDVDDDSQKGWNREDVDGLFCPICMEPWTNDGDHQPSCLTCGHLFGMSCIKEWLKRQRSSGKCPQCNKKCTLKDVRRIYGSRVVVVDEESQKRIRFLEAKCETLEKKDKEWRKKQVDWHKKVLVWQAEVREHVNQVTERLERRLSGLESKALRLAAAADRFQELSARGNDVGLTYCPASYEFTLQQELPLDGARCFDVDDSGQTLIIARRPTRIGGPNTLTKMSLAVPHDQDTVPLPSNAKAVRDLHVSPFGKLALLASMGKKLSVVSMESNNIVVNYDLPAAAWSCSWDINSSHYVHAGLQNGMLLVFDLRQTSRPLESRSGLTSNPIHTICSLSQDSTVQSGTKKLLTASSVGLCQWNIGGALEQPSLISETVNQGVCISLAYCPKSDNIVATFRPKVEMPDEIGISQQSQAPCSTMGHHVQGSHVVIKRVDSNYQKLRSTYGYVPGIRLPKSTIFGVGNDNSVFSCGDEATSELVLQDLPSLTVTERLKSHHPIRDVKYTASLKPGLLCCLSEDKMQFFSHRLL